MIQRPDLTDQGCNMLDVLPEMTVGLDKAERRQSLFKEVGQKGMQLDLRRSSKKAIKV